MTNTPRETFEIVRRGYEPTQVDRRLAALTRELEQARARQADLERRAEELQAQGPQEEGAATPYAGLGAISQHSVTDPSAALQATWIG